MLLYWIWLAQMSKVSAHMKQKLLQHFRDPEDIYYADEQAYGQISGLTEDAIEALMEKDLTQAEEIAQSCKEKGIQILTYGDRQYPNSLKNIYDPPMVLYFTGVLPEWETVPVIGIVGTRKATAYGLNTALRFGSQICACGALVVSGGATGIDSMAMEGALEAGGPVVCVLGCGVDVVYPAKNKLLFSKVTANGCLLSEYPPQTQALAWHFPHRNRIITGIANGLLVVEAPERSGALISARHAMDQGRDVFVVPGNVDVEACSGSNALLEEAIPALSGWHVVREYEAQYPGKVCRRELPKAAERPQALVAQPQGYPSEAAPQKEEADKKSIDKSSKSTYSVVNNLVSALTEQEQLVFAQIGAESCTVDDLIGRTELPPATVKSILTKLTIKGVVRNLPGGRIAVK